MKEELSQNFKNLYKTLQNFHWKMGLKPITSQNKGRIKRLINEKVKSTLKSSYGTGKRGKFFFQSLSVTILSSSKPLVDELDNTIPLTFDFDKYR